MLSQFYKEIEGKDFGFIRYASVGWIIEMKS